MSKLYFSASDSLLTILKKIQRAPDENLVLEIPQENIFWQGSANRKLVAHVATAAQKNLTWADPTPAATSAPTEPKSTTAPTKSPKTKKRRGLGFSKVILGLVLTLILFASSAFVFVYYYLPRATVTLTVAEKALEGLQEVELVPDLAKIEPDQNKLPAFKLKVAEEDEETFAATGQKQVGDKATGEVTLQNWTDQPITLAAETTLTVEQGQTGAGLKFVTTEKTVIPAQSMTQPEADKKVFEAGTAQVGLQAEQFGTEYNLAAKTSFSVAGFDRESLLAQNSQALSGGTTQEVTVVSGDDLTRSQDKLSAKLFAKGREDLASKLVGDQKMIEELTTQTILQQTASAKEGDAVDQFKIKMQTQSQSLAYSESDLKSTALQKLETLVPEGFRISSDQKIVTIQSVAKSKDGSVKATVKVKTLVVPDFDLTGLKGELLGKSFKEAISILSHKEKLLDYQIQTWPLLPDFLRTLPHRPERLTITIVTP